jgi:hypothetical protein
MTHGTGDTASLFSSLLDETVGPFTVRVDDVEVILDAPGPEIGDALDEGAGPLDVLELMIEDDDELDDVLDALDARPLSAAAEIVEAARWHWGLVNPPPEGFRRVCAELDRYGAAIEFDFQSLLGVDLGEFIRNPERWSWSKFMRLLSGLPAGHHYAAALALDIELAEAVAAKRAADEAAGIKVVKDNRPSLIGWTAERAELVAVKDGIRRIEHAVWGASPKFKGKGGKSPKASPRPRVAADVIEARRMRLEHDDIAGQMLGKRYTPSTMRGRK